MSSNKTVIAVDAMGGDLGPSVVVPGAIEAARQTGAKILLVGNEATLDGELNRLSPSGVDLEIVHAPEVAGMDEKPSDILRRKKNASIQVACRLVRDGAAQGVVSAGHSGASVACGMFIMGRIPGVERPALASLLPDGEGTRRPPGRGGHRRLQALQHIPVRPDGRRLRQGHPQ